MGIAILCLGASGSGKSTSLRNFKKGEVCVLNVANKPLPFRNDLATVKADQYKVIGGMLAAKEYKTYVIDDSQYLLAFELFRRSPEKGYEKYTEMALHFQQMLEYISLQLPDDVIVYLMHHTDVGSDGKLKAKTIGKMLDEKLTLEGLFTIVLLAQNNDGNYTFLTNGQEPVKTPMGMFKDAQIPNDLKMVDETVRTYYGLNKKGDK